MMTTDRFRWQFRVHAAFTTVLAAFLVLSSFACSSMKNQAEGVEPLEHREPTECERLMGEYYLRGCSVKRPPNPAACDGLRNVIDEKCCWPH